MKENENQKQGKDEKKKLVDKKIDLDTQKDGFKQNIQFEIKKMKNKLTNPRQKNVLAICGSVFKFFDGVVGITAKTALTYIILRFFTKPDDLEQLGKDLKQFAPLFGAESLNAGWQSFGIFIRLLQLVNRGCEKKRGRGFWLLSTEKHTVELVKDIADRIFKFASALCAAIPTGRGVFASKEARGGNAWWFIGAGSIALAHAPLDTIWDTIWKASKKDMYEIVDKDGMQRIKDLGLGEKICKILFEKLVAHECSFIGAGCLVTGLRLIIAGKVEAGCGFMTGSGVGFGASALQQLGTTLKGVYDDYVSESNPISCKDVFSRPNPSRYTNI